jgi:predicted NBD/HSP70 family sugar kinase
MVEPFVCIRVKQFDTSVLAFGTGTNLAMNTSKPLAKRSSTPRTSSVRFAFTGNQSASNKTPREINRNLVFNLIRTHQPVSRADLARLSGLQRSTVSLIVEILIRERWIIEGSTGRLPRGRRPTFLHLNDQRAVIALDIHTSQTTVAVVDLGGKIISQNIVILPEDPGKAVSTIVREVKKVLGNKDRAFDGIGISVPGRPEPNPSHPIFTPRLKWSVLNLQERLQRATGLRVKMDNVANGCVLSEVWFGDSDGVHDLVVVNVSEGIGAGIFVNGRILRGKDGMAGEFGHIQIESAGPACACGGQGCWEGFASNRAGLRYYQEMSGKPALPSFDALVRMAQSGDAMAIGAIEKMSLYLGRGLRMIGAALAPSEIVVVGEITNAWYLFGATIETEMKHNSLPGSPRLRPSVEASTARLRSAVALVMNEGSI